MITDPRTNAAHGRRWALWLFMFVGVVIHSSLCPPNVHAGVLSATTRTCVSSAAGTPPLDVSVPGRGEVPDTGSVADARRPCAPAPRPHHHQPCGVVNHRGLSQQRALGEWQAGAMPWFLLPAPFAGGPGVVAGFRAESSRPPAASSGAVLLIDLCSSRT